MLRPNLLYSFNENVVAPGEMDHLFDNLKGTAYTNCYTPAPDSPRSLACLYTGLYPKNNGCTTRIKWPKYYLKPEAETIFDMLSKKSYTTHINLTESEEKTGFLPDNIKGDICLHDSTDKIMDVFRSNIESDTDSAYFINLNDYHWSMDDYGHNSMGDYYGQKHLKTYIDMLFQGIDIEDIDYLFIYSDHGFLLDNEKVENQLLLTNDNRSKITMFVRKKGDNILKKNRKLSSIMDIHPTLNEILELTENKNSDGISLFSDEEYENIVIEDHKNFSVSLEQLIENWSIRTREYHYYKSLDDDALFKVMSDHEYIKIGSINGNIREILEGKIRDVSLSYQDTLIQHEILKSYQALYNCNFHYSSGESRFNGRRSIAGKIQRLLYRNKYIRW